MKLAAHVMLFVCYHLIRSIIFRFFHSCISFYIQVPTAKKEEVKEENKEPEGPKFQAFTGRKYSLRDWVAVCLQTLLLQDSCGVNMWNNRRSKHCLYHFEAKTTSTNLVWASSIDIYLVLDVVLVIFMFSPGFGSLGHPCATRMWNKTSVYRC